MNYKYRILVTGILLLIISSCYNKSIRSTTLQDNKNFFTLSLQEIHEKFSSLPMERQYEIYIYSMTKVHPPDLSFAYEFAKINGIKALPFLIQKLKNEPDENKQFAIIYLFKIAAVFQPSNFKTHNNIVILIEKTISGMKIEANKKNSMSSLEKIKESIGILH